ncbi:MAG: hypothetical protein ACI4TD_10955 [Phocaeicola sp.]
MKYIAKEDLNCEFGILKVGDNFEADPKDERVVHLMVAGKIIAEEQEPEPKKSRKNAKKAKEEVVEKNSDTEPEVEETASDEE